MESFYSFKMNQLALNRTKNKAGVLGVCTVLGMLIFCFSKDFGMFWDNVLFASKMGNHLYENGIFNWNLPISFDPGHPPFLGMLLAITWTIFGHSLWASHLLMLPFIIGTIYQIHRLTFYFTRNIKLSAMGSLLILADPSLLSSFVLVNPETIILFFFFLTLNGIFYKNQKWKFIGLLFLSIISFRSMMLFAGIFLYEIFQQRVIEKKKWKQCINLRFSLYYLLSALPGILYVAWRLFSKGWLQTHPDSPWSSLWQFPSLKEFSRNILVLIWRYIDFGRVFIILFLIFGLIYLWRKKKINNTVRQLLFLSFCSVFFVILASIFSTNGFGHRYFIVSYLTLSLTAFLILQELTSSKNVLHSLLFFGLITGNFWVYPENISQGWDATLAHIPYHSLRTEAIHYLDSESIDLDNVGTFFPNYNSEDEIMLNGDQRRLNQFNKQNEYIFYSNVYNLSDEELRILDKNYEEIQRFSRFQVYISILKRSDSDD